MENKRQLKKKKGKKTKRNSNERQRRRMEIKKRTGNKAKFYVLLKLQ